MSTKYRLLKDLPDSKAGDIYEWNTAHFLQYGAYFRNGQISESYWMKESVEGNIAWFEKIEESSPPRFYELRKALVDLKEVLSKFPKEEKLYTIEDMRKCFEAARSQILVQGSLATSRNTYLDFDDYLKSIKQ